MSVLVSKDKLVETLTKNRSEHRAIFEAALVKYHEKCKEVLQERIDDLASAHKQPIRLVFGLPVPEDHTDSYSDALDRLTWEERDQVELDDDEFRELVMNKWTWARSFHANTTSYIAS